MPIQAHGTARRPSDANLQAKARPTWPVAPVIRIMMPLHVPA